MAAYGWTIFIAAFLLFQVQPILGKYLLPWFGGGTGVWTTCLVFFQAVLLCGYAYAHWSARHLKLRYQVVLHLVLAAAALVSLPIAPHESWKPGTASSPAFGIIVLLARSIGLPFFVLAATAPLLQHWSNHAHRGASPFRLYALSNAGSLLGLLTYPALFESSFSRATQTTLWSAGLGAYAAGCCLCATGVWNARNDFPKAANTPAAGTPRKVQPAARTRQDWLWWLLLPACASVLLLAVTNQLCQEVAVIPLLWVVPLAVYLLSFILCFEKPGLYGRRWFGPALLASLVTLAALASGSFTVSIPVQILASTVALLICCVVCHGELYRLRPAPERLTSFYLVLAAGGAMGGVFVALLAPGIFSDFFELQWGLIFCGALFLLLWGRDLKAGASGSGNAASWCASVIALAGLGAVLWQGTRHHADIRVERCRNFYGVLSVYRHEQTDPALGLMELVHGRVAHGVQFLNPAYASLPTLYYSPASGVGRAVQALSPGPRRIGVVGLGIGTLAAYGRKGDYLRFYEINPEVERLARTRFSYLSNSLAQIEVVLGDARQSLEFEPDQNFDLLVLDAFNGDTIPTHLLTREAIDLYARHLRTNGLLAIHISNANLNLEPILTRLAQDRAFRGATMVQPENDPARGLLASTWIALARDRDKSRLAELGPTAAPLATAPASAPLWTDEFSSLFGALRWKQILIPSPVPRAATPSIATSAEKKHNLALQLDRYRLAVSQNPNSSLALNNLACLLAMAPDPALRNGTEAVKLAEQAASITQFRNPSVLSTLAAAYAESGRFDEAIATAERARTLAAEMGQPGLVEGNLRMLEYFRRREPYHQAPAPAK